jgi:two-component system cell cycle response regulator CtrA
MPKRRPDYLEVLEADNEQLRARVSELEARVAKLSSAAEFTVMTPVSKFGLTASEGRIFARIVATGFATKDDLHAAICHGKAIEPEPKIVDVYVCKIRAKLEPFEIVIETAHGRGYKIGPESMAKIMSIQTGTHIEMAG